MALFQGKRIQIPLESNIFRLFHFLAKLEERHYPQ